MKKLLLLATAVCIVVLANFSTVSSSVMPHCMNWNVLVVYDEEMVATANSFPGFYFFSADRPLSVKDYVRTQLERAAYRFENEFGIQYYAVDYVQWESNDSLKRTEELLYDAIEKVGFSPGMWIGGNIVHGLIVWTNQKTEDNYGGGALPNERAVIINYQQTWADDNVLQHELSHLHGAALDDHSTNIKCVMAHYRIHVDFYWEPLEPIGQGYVLLYLGMYDTIPGGYIRNEWCDECKRTIETHSNFWQYNYFIGDEGLLEGLPPPNYWRILIIVALVVAGVLGVWVVLRIVKHVRKKKANAKGQ